MFTLYLGSMVKSTLEYEDEFTMDNTVTDENKVTDLLFKLEYLTENGVTKDVPAMFSELVTTLKKFNADQMSTFFYQSDKYAQKFLIDAFLVVNTPASMHMLTDLILDDVISTKDQQAWITSLSFIKHPKLKMFSAIQVRINYIIFESCENSEHRTF